MEFGIGFWKVVRPVCH